VVCSRDRGNENLVSIKGGEMPYQFCQYYFLKKYYACLEAATVVWLIGYENLL
jgi:hypothetical protein